MGEQSDNRIGQNIRCLRKRQDWTLRELADRLGYDSYSIVGKWEAGKATPPISTIEKLADLFRIPVNAILKSNLWEVSDNSMLWFLQRSCAFFVHKT